MSCALAGERRQVPSKLLGLDLLQALLERPDVVAIEVQQVDDLLNAQRIQLVGHQTVRALAEPLLQRLTRAAVRRRAVRQRALRLLLRAVRGVAA